MATKPSYGNQPVFREFNRISNVIDATGFFKTAFVDVSEYNNFNLTFYNGNLNLLIDLIYSLDGLNDVTGLSFTEQLNPPGDISLQFVGTFTVKTRYLAFTVFGSQGDEFGIQLVFS